MYEVDSNRDEQKLALLIMIRMFENPSVQGFLPVFWLP
jgi:hypothetical protein